MIVRNRSMGRMGVSQVNVKARRQSGRTSNAQDGTVRELARDCVLDLPVGFVVH